MGGVPALVALLVGAHPGDLPPADPDGEAVTKPQATPASRGPRRTIVVEPRTPEGTAPERASSVVTKELMEERIPRSVPEALRYEPGVTIQQTGHGQASPYIRGVTGQQTVMFFDGVRLNTSTFRQGPNQYFFTVDSYSTESLEVIRGSSSTRFGSDAMGGTILAVPVEPTLAESRKWSVHPTAFMRTQTADGELGGRGQLDVAWSDRLGFVGGVGYRDLGYLRSGGKLKDPEGQLQQTIPPRFADDGKTQLGTGFRELSSDGRLTLRLAPKHRLTAAIYDYRQLDAPRTDKCPEPGEDLRGCLVYQEQFRLLSYLGWDVTDGPRAAETVRWTLSYQRQHERRRDTKGGLSQDVTFGRDDVHSIGSGLALRTREWEPAGWFSAHLEYGADAYLDLVDSTAWVRFLDVGITEFFDRGQYVDGSRYLTSGAWTQIRTLWWDRVGLRVGGRLAVAAADTPAVEAAETAAIRRTWVAPVGNVGLSVKTTPWLDLLLGVDQGFRAPNLDDLTSRQKTGQGFQLENADLTPERATTAELGLKIRHPWIELQGFLWGTRYNDQIIRDIIDSTECPPSDSQCNSFASVVQLTNAPEPSYGWGVDGGVRLFLPADIRLRSSIAYTWGEQYDPATGGRGPMSRIPPLGGTAELGYYPDRWGFFVSGGLRWATQQDRLSLGDRGDPRIPFPSGTPGYAVFDLRAGYKLAPYIRVGFIFENVGDAPYRVHGSSINGPGRSLLTTLAVGF